jgi:hypothetical protein
MDIAGVLSEAWGIYRRHFARLFLIGAAVSLVLTLATGIPSAILGTGGDWGFVYAVVSAVPVIVGYCWLQGALTHATVELRDGRADVALADLFAAVRPVLPALAGAGILAGLGIGVGLILFVVPGLYLLTRWSMLAPVVVLERARIGEAFTRSGQLVRGNGWSVFGLLMPLVFIGLVAAAVISTVLAAILPGVLGGLIGSTLTGAVVTPFVAIAMTLTYLRLHEAAPQVGRDEVAMIDPQCRVVALASLCCGIVTGAVVVLGPVLLAGDTGIPPVTDAAIVATGAFLCGVVAVLLGASLFAFSERGLPPSERWGCSGVHRLVAASGMILGFVFIWPALLELLFALGAD